MVCVLLISIFPHLGKPLKQLAHGTVVVQPDPHLDAQQPLRCFLGGNHFRRARRRLAAPARSSSVAQALDSHGVRVVGPLDDTLF